MACTSTRPYQKAMPLEKAMWGDTFGMLVDRFGINWVVNISGAADDQR